MTVKVDTVKGNGTRWTIGILVTVAVVVLGWTLNHHEADMREAGEQRKMNAAHIGKVAERAAVLEANMVNLKSDVSEIKKDVKSILGRMPG